MMRGILRGLAGLGAGFALIAAAPGQPPRPGAFDRGTRTEAANRVNYGTGPLQFAELWLPKGRGPYPVVMLIHGGCWRTAVADRSVMDPIALDLAKRGIAVWNVEYRGIDRPGGGYPGTYQDVAAAADMLRRAGPLFQLKTDQVVAIGHSAGAHLALWLAGRPGIALASALYARRPAPIPSVIALGGVVDLAAEAADRSRPCDLAGGARAMAGPKTPQRPNIYADTSPAAMPPFAARQTFVNGDQDDIAPPELAIGYAMKTAVKGVRPKRITVSGADHMALIAPDSPAWKRIVPVIRGELGLTAEK